MDLPDDVLDALFAAGAAGLTFNAPLGAERAEKLATTLAELPVRSLVDLGCGRGALARLMATHLRSATVLGVDTDQDQINLAASLADQAGLADRLSFEVADASTWTGSIDAAICIGASHAFGGTTLMLQRIGSLLPSGVAVIGDSMWQSEPTSWCLETFGELPSGLGGLTAAAEETGWSVVEASAATLEEWDEFEHGWIDGVRTVGSAEATEFADLREAQYADYRGVLGFGWLLLTR